MGWIEIESKLFLLNEFVFLLLWKDSLTCSSLDLQTGDVCTYRKDIKDSIQQNMNED